MTRCLAPLLACAVPPRPASATLLSSPRVHRLFRSSSGKSPDSPACFFAKSLEAPATHFSACLLSGYSGHETAPARQKKALLLDFHRRASRKGNSIKRQPAALVVRAMQDSGTGDNADAVGRLKDTSAPIVQPESPDLHSNDRLNTEDHNTSNKGHERNGGRVLTPEEHWQRYKPQLHTRYGQWRFWLPAQGREAKLSLQLLRAITPVEGGSEEYILRHEPSNRQGSFPAKVAEGAWPFSCARDSRSNGIALPYGIYSQGARVLCAGGEGGEGAVVMAQLQVGGGGGEGKDGGEKAGQGSVASAPRTVLLTSNVCFMDGPSAQLNVAFSETSVSLRQDDIVVLPESHLDSYQGVDRAGGGSARTSESTSSQSWLDTWISPHWKTPLPTHLPASPAPLPPKPLYGVPHYIYADLYSTPFPELPIQGVETQHNEVFSGYLAGVPEAQRSRYAVRALPRGVVVALPDPLEGVLGRGGEKGQEFWLVVTYVRGGGGGGGCGGEGSGGGGERQGEMLLELSDIGYLVEGDWKVQQVVVAYGKEGEFLYGKHTTFV